MTADVLAGGLLLALALRLASVLAAVLFARRRAAGRVLAFSGALLASVVTGSLGALVVASGTPVSGPLLRHAATGLELHAAIDPLAGWFLVVLALVGGAVALYSIGYFTHGYTPPQVAFVGAGYNVLLASVELVFVAADAVGFLFAWELMTIATASLVVTEHQHRETRRAAFLYLAMSHVGTGCLLAAFLLLARGGSGSLAFASLLGAHAAAVPARDLVFALAFVGFGVKAGLIPLHVWLPEAHPAAPSPVSALMSGVLIKAGVYGIYRVCVLGLGVPAPAWGIAVLLLGAVSMVLGVLYALMQHDLKRLLAYHSIENVGIILLAAGAGMLAWSVGRPGLAALAFAASLLHVLNHALFKGLLFLGAGGVVAATGTRQIERMGGLVHRMPWTAAFFLVAAAAISGLPFLNGFVSEWLVLQSLLLGFHGSSDTFVRVAFPVGGALLGLTTALAAVCFVKAFGVTFLALPRSPEAAAARESGALLLAPQALLALACVGLGLFPAPVVAALGRLGASLTGASSSPVTATPLQLAPLDGSFDWLSLPVAAAAVGAGLALAALLSARSAFRRRRAPAWGCGGELTAEAEYTATAFSKSIMMIFSSILRPTTEVSRLETTRYYAREVRYHAEVEPTFERFVYNPLTRGVLTVADRLRVIQAGSLHAYLAYVMVLVLLLVVLVGWRG